MVGMSHHYNCYALRPACLVLPMYAFQWSYNCSFLSYENCFYYLLYELICHVIGTKTLRKRECKRMGKRIIFVAYRIPHPHAAAVCRLR